MGASIWLSHCLLGVIRRRCLHIHGKSRRERHRALHLIETRSRDDLQVNVAAKSIRAAQELGRGEHSVHGGDRSSTNGRRQEEAEGSALLVQLDERACQLVRQERDM